MDQVSFRRNFVKFHVNDIELRLSSMCSRLQCVTSIDRTHNIWVEYMIV